MKERPILFTPQMVRAILDGTKTKTRQIMKPQPSSFTEAHDCFEHVNGGGFTVGPDSCPPGMRPFRWWTFDRKTNGILEYTRLGEKSTPAQRRRAEKWHANKSEPSMWSHDEVRTLCPHGQPGDRMWVRETFMPMPHLNAKAFYRASDPLVGGKWKPSIFMPRHLSRITLEIVSVRVERLHDISEEDAKAEGVPPALKPPQISQMEKEGWEWLPYTTEFRGVWEDINGPGSWEANPWVWVIEFKRVEGKP
jgi:hypothetical protein